MGIYYNSVINPLEDNSIFQNEIIMSANLIIEIDLPRISLASSLNVIIIGSLKYPSST